MSQELMDYFDSTDWYNGTIPAEQFDESVLNDYERTNAEFLREVEYGNDPDGYKLDEPGYDIYALEEDDIPGAKLTKQQAYAAVYRYLDDSLGMDMVYEYHGYFVFSDDQIGQAEENEYVFMLRSYTSAHVYYYVNAYTGDVYEVQENPIESVYGERIYIFNVFDGAASIADSNTGNTESVDYSVLRDFIFNFPEHGRDEYALPGREEIHDEAGMIAWLENHGWTDYVNLSIDSSAPSAKEPAWVYEARNGAWKLSGYSYIEWHEKVDDDYSMGCSVSISIQCSEEDGDTVYENCKDILSGYFYQSYRDVEDETSPIIWSGFFDEDSVSRVIYDYDTRLICVSFNDSIEASLLGVFWNGIPLQRDGVILDIPVTLSMIPPQ